MLPRHHDPIVAVATAPGRGAVGIVRLSGRGLGALVQALCGRALEPRLATYLPFLDARGEAIDRGLALWFPAPHSYTGEDVLELHAHGGPVVLQLLVARCLEAAAQIDDKAIDGKAISSEAGGEVGHALAGTPRLPDLRVARPGEFTERAFLNDKLDLAQAEAVADLIDAATEAAARSAGRSLAGAFSAEVQVLRDRLVELRALVEATLDFPEEEIDFLERSDARGRLAGIAAVLDAVRARARQGALLREGLRVVIAGQPNVGKSSLLNALAGAELAIVTPIPGTTRDKVSQTIQIRGVPIHVTDTAGLREERGGGTGDDESAVVGAAAADEDEGDAATAAGTAGRIDAVERIGIERAWAEVASADAVLFLHDLTRIGDPGYDAEEARIAARIDAACGARARPDARDARDAVHSSPRDGESRLLHVYNKADAVPGREGVPSFPGAAPATVAAGIVGSPTLPAGSDGDAAGDLEAVADRVPAAAAAGPVVVSALTGAGVDALRERLLDLAGWHAQPEGVFIARTRHLHVLADTAAHVAAAAALLDEGREAALELVAEELRLAHDRLGEITGRFSADDLLGEIFGRFCIGK